MTLRSESKEDGMTGKRVARCYVLFSERFGYKKENRRKKGVCEIDIETENELSLGFVI